MACCLKTKRNHLNQCKLLINEVLRHRPASNFQDSALAACTYLHYIFEKYNFKIDATFARGTWVKERFCPYCTVVPSFKLTQNACSNFLKTVENPLVHVSERQKYINDVAHFHVAVKLDISPMNTKVFTAPYTGILSIWGVSSRRLLTESFRCLQIVHHATHIAIFLNKLQCLADSCEPLRVSLLLHWSLHDPNPTFSVCLSVWFACPVPLPTHLQTHCVNTQLMETVWQQNHIA